MKKFFTLLALMLLCSVGAWAQDPRAGYSLLTSINDFDDEIEVYFKNVQDGNKYISGVTGNTTSWSADNNIVLHKVDENQYKFQFKSANGAQYIKYDMDDVNNTSAALTSNVDEATVFTVSAYGTNTFRFTFGKAGVLNNAPTVQSQLVMANGALVCWGAADGAAKRNWSVYKKNSDEPVALPLEVSTNDVKHNYQIKNNNSEYYLNPFTFPTNVESERGVYQFYATSNNGEYHIFEVGSQKWLTYSNTDNQVKKIGFADQESAASAWAVYFTESTNDDNAVNISPATKIATSFNWFGGVNVGSYPYNIGKDNATTCTVGFYNSTDPNSKWLLSEIAEAGVDAAIANSRNYATKAPVTELVRLAKVYNGLIGDGLGEYSTTDDGEYSYSAAEWAQVIEQVETQLASNSPLLPYSVATLQTIYDNITINMPKSGTFLRMKSNVHHSYISIPDNHATGASLVMSATANNDNIFYYSNGKLLAYSTGYYVKNNNHAQLGEISTITFDASKTGALGTYAITSSGKNPWYSPGVTGNINNYGGANHANCNWILEEVTELPVTLNANSGCASFYAPVAMTVTEGDAYIAVEKGASTITLSPIANNVIPAGSGVILKGTGAATLTVGGTATETRENALKGSEYTKVKPTDEGTIYVLVNNNSAPAFQQYSGANVNGFKAYLPISSGESNFRVVFDNDTVTGINTIEANVGGEIFDLQGRRVQNANSGLYIVDGKKVIR